MSHICDASLSSDFHVAAMDCMIPMFLSSENTLSSLRHETDEPNIIVKGKVLLFFFFVVDNLSGSGEDVFI